MSFALLSLLTGCVMESASYGIGPEQALTLVRNKPYFWSNEFLRNVTVTSLPACMRRYRLPTDEGKAGSVKVYRASGGDYVMQDGMGQYRVEIATCEMSLEDKTSAPGELLGAFESVPDGGIRFVPASGAQKK
ncbi:MAG: hypothetical protein KJ958_04260 [Gammaproteobacteria bacterium]|nr:hypothetical protein [Gammaproteobacteria bacterium]MBU1978366.1 hypothetical protein [Gammaproteobacteria bacterium]